MSVSTRPRRVRNQSLLHVDDARKSYGGVDALQGVSFQVSMSEIVALLGPNGAGKTTLIKAICGRHRLDAGSIRLLGQKMERRQRRRLGLVPQELAIYPDLTVRENLVVFGRLHGVRPRMLRSQVSEILDWTRLTNRQNHLAGSLSGGMQRRLNIGCGVLHRPKLLLLDEPTVGVDPQSREKIFDMLTELKDQGTAILLTTHQLDEAQNRSERVVIIDQGRVIASGTVEELIARTVNTQGKLTMQTMHHETGHHRRETFTRDLQNVVKELPLILEDMGRQGIGVERLSVQSPSLQDVFLHLTGRELRE